MTPPQTVNNKDEPAAPSQWFHRRDYVIPLVLVLFGLLSCSLGMLGGFIWRTMDEVRGRPGYVIRRAEGFAFGSDEKEHATVLSQS